MGSYNRVQRRIRGERFSRFAESIFGKNNAGWQVVVYAMLFLTVAGWLPDGLSEFIDYFRSGRGEWSFNYKLAFSAPVLIVFWLLIRKSGIFGGKIEVYSEQPQPVKVLGLFLSPFRPIVDAATVNSQVKNRNELELVLQGGAVSQEMFSGTTWEMPLKAIGFHFSRLQKVCLITSSGEKGTCLESPLFILLSQSLYPGIIVEEFTSGGIDFENVSDVFSVVEKLYEEAGSERYRENDVLVDITGGQKTNSIAAAIATLSTGRQFQYIGKQNNNVLCYDVRLFDESRHQ
jgi:hypothetical protein